MTEQELLEEMDIALMKNNTSRMLVACKKMFELILKSKIIEEKPAIRVLDENTPKLVEKPVRRRPKNV